MSIPKAYILLLFMLMALQLSGQNAAQSELNWKITNRASIVLNLDNIKQLPHQDNIELSGKNISSIIYYTIDEDKNLRIEKDIIFPQLRTFNKSNEPDWKKYRAYFRRTADDFLTPKISYDNHIIMPSKVDSIEIGGLITFYYSPVKGLKISRSIYPSMNTRLLVEEWQIENTDSVAKPLAISPVTLRQSEAGHKGNYTFLVQSQANKKTILAPHQVYAFPVYFGALLNDENSADFNYINAKASRDSFLTSCRNSLILNTPDNTLNTLFYFSKIRAAESIFNSSMGLIHSPGGGNYYVGIWANDQIEYSGPFFPYMGYETAETAAYNAYKKFLENIPEDGHHIPYAFEVDGHFPMTHLDRGDAAMIAYGTSLYLLNSGNTEQAKELWPLIEWSLEYCHNNRNQFGAVESESDEMEGRIATGDANLSTSSLYYGGLKFSIPIAKRLGMPDKAADYEGRLSAMEDVIEDYFGSTLEGLKTYRYFDENKYLRHWICLPLTMGITKRKAGTLSALFEKLWTDNGILVQYDPTTETEPLFWDRATLYALRGALKVGENKLAIDKLKQYSTKRLLGDHVPYAVEAYPENNMKHLSAESALYCRIFIEGLLGIEPLSFSEFKMVPSLPDDWNYLELKRFYLFGIMHNISIRKEGEKLRLIIETDQTMLYNEAVNPSETIYINTETK